MAKAKRSESCEVCGNDLLLYKCKHCGKIVCEQHKAPERHMCESLHSNRVDYDMGTVIERAASAIDERDESVESEGMPERRSMLAGKGTLAIKLLAVIVVIGAVIAALVFLIGYMNNDKPIYSVSIPVTNALGKQVTLVDYSNATDPTYANLTRFLAADGTINNRYVYPNFTCADFARTLHDNAEKAGIKCGFVDVEFENQTIDYRIYDNGNGNFTKPAGTGDVGHGLDVFNTVDRGLVYVDASSDNGYTGDGHEEVRIAYIVKGKELNEIDLSHANDTSYSFYESYKKENLDLVQEQRQYYSDRKVLDDEIQANDGFMNMTMKEKNDELNMRAVSLNDQENQSGPFYYPLGIVKSVDIYW